MHKYTLSDLASIVDGKLILNGASNDDYITSIATLNKANNNSLSFYTNPKYKKDVADTKAGLILTSPKYSDVVTRPCLLVDNTHVAYAKLAKVFYNKLQNNPIGIHKSAIIGDHCEIDSSVSIGPNVVIGNNAKISANCIIKANVVIGDNCLIDASTVIYPNAVLYNNTTIGSDCIIHSGAVIGSDGFGFAFTDDKKWLKVPQLGGVTIESDVEVGANTTIDCGAVEDTVIKRGVKLDNQIHIAHNVVVDEYSIMAAQVGIAGSSKVGKYCAFGGGSAVSGHVSVANGVKLAGFATVGKSIDAPGFYASGTGPVLPYTKWRRLSIHFENLDKYVTKIKNIEKSNEVS